VGGHRRQGGKAKKGKGKDRRHGRGGSSQEAANEFVSEIQSSQVGLSKAEKDVFDYIFSQESVMTIVRHKVYLLGQPEENRLLMAKMFAPIIMQDLKLGGGHFDPEILMSTRAVSASMNAQMSSDPDSNPELFWKKVEETIILALTYRYDEEKVKKDFLEILSRFQYLKEKKFRGKETTLQEIVTDFFELIFDLNMPNEVDFYALRTRYGLLTEIEEAREGSYIFRVKENFPLKLEDGEPLRKRLARRHTRDIHYLALHTVGEEAPALLAVPAEDVAQERESTVEILNDLVVEEVEKKEGTKEELPDQGAPIESEEVPVEEPAEERASPALEENPEPSLLKPEKTQAQIEKEFWDSLDTIMTLELTTRTGALPVKCYLHVAALREQIKDDSIMRKIIEVAERGKCASPRDKQGIVFFRESGQDIFYRPSSKHQPRRVGAEIRVDGQDYRVVGHIRKSEKGEREVHFDGYFATPPWHKRK
jgi:hypothetical protein